MIVSHLYMISFKPVRYIFLTITFYLLQHQLFAQDIVSSNNLAEQYMHDAKYADAIKLYKRIAYFDSTASYTKSIFKKMGDCYFELNKFEEAAECYDVSFFSQNDSILKNECIILKSKCLLSLSRYMDGLAELENMSYHLNDSQLNQKIFYKAVFFYFKGMLDSAENNFSLLTPDSNNKKTLHLMLLKVKEIEKISPKKAKIMSKIIPGSGQLYAHDYKNAINSFVLTLGLGTLYAVTAYNYTVLDAFLSVYPWFHRYYIGGANKAFIITQKRKDNLKKQSLFQIVQLIKL